MKIVPFDRCSRLPLYRLTFYKITQSYLFTNIIRLPGSPQSHWIFFIFVHQLSKMVFHCFFDLHFSIGVRLRLFSCLSATRISSFVNCLFTVLAWFSFGLSLCYRFFKIPFMTVDINPLLRIFSPEIVTSILGSWKLRGHLSFNTMVTLIHETLHCVGHSSR